MATDMELLWGLIILLLLIMFTIFVYVVYCGLFYDIKVDACKPPFDNLMIAYKFARGSYKECGHLFTEVHSLVPHLHCIGVYYDDPKQVSPECLRYLVGVIVGSKDVTANSDDQTLLEAKGYQFATFPSVDYVVMTSFPFKGRLSIAIAVARVYPVLSSYIEEKRLCAHPMLEIYRDSDILFAAPLSKQDEFYVAEASADSTGEISASQDDSSNEEKEDPLPSKPLLVVGSAPVPSVGETEPAPNEAFNGNGSDKSSASSFEELNLDK